MTKQDSTSHLGMFSISLAVKDLAASRAFYEGLGFAAVQHDSDPPPGYGATFLMLRSGNAMIGLFQGLFPTNTITFNPSDVRAVQRQAKAAGIAFKLEAPDGTGPAAAFTMDPDGNPVLLDQH
jgi:lactoylglutathione lyase